MCFKVYLSKQSCTISNIFEFKTPYGQICFFFYFEFAKNSTPLSFFSDRVVEYWNRHKYYCSTGISVDLFKWNLYILEFFKGSNIIRYRWQLLENLIFHYHYCYYSLHSMSTIRIKSISSHRESFAHWCSFSIFSTYDLWYQYHFLKFTIDCIYITQSTLY